MLRVLIAALVVLVPVGGMSAWADEPGPQARLLVPAYFYPAGKNLEIWRAMIRSADDAPIVAIVNPASGPGKRVDDNYRQMMHEISRSKVTPIGYVTLSYAKRPAAEVRAEVDAWIRLYPEIRGIFFDEQPSGADDAPQVVECFDYAAQQIRDAVVVSNPGVVCAREYFAGKSPVTICTFEHHLGFEKYQLPAWAAELPPERFAVLPYDVQGAAAMRDVLQSAVKKRAGYVYITDEKFPMPWGKLPSYWDEEVQAVAALNAARGAAK